MNNNYLTHYGVLGMKWGVRKSPRRIMVTKKRRLAAAKRDLEKLNSGKKLSVGLTKKRQAAYNKKDKAFLEKRIDRLEKLNSGEKVSVGLTKKRRVALDKNDKTKTKIKDMSDAELRKQINRLRMEKEYRTLRGQSHTVGRGVEATSNVLKVVGTVAVGSTAMITLYNNSKSIQGIVDGAIKR